MPQTKTPRRATPHKTTSARKPRARSSREPKQPSPADRTAALSEEVLRSLESGQRAAIDAVRKFVDTVDEKLPALGERPSRRQEIVDAAMEMADRLVHTQYDFIRDVVQSAGKALNRQDERK
jgi:hypothetical protein